MNVTRLCPCPVRGVFLLNVVAVLLDKFTQSQSYEEDQSALSNWAVENYNSLDPLLNSLACIDTRVQTQKDTRQPLQNEAFSILSLFC